MKERKLRSSAQSWTSAERLASENRLFAILDACDAPAVPRKAEELGVERAIPLYLGRLDAVHWPIGPYLFHLDKPTLNWIAAALKREPWGIFAVPESPEEVLQKLFAHFQKFVTIRVRDEELYLRFYDPRVLPQYLHRAPEDKMREFFGPCRFLGAANAQSDRAEPGELSWYWLE